MKKICEQLGIKLHTDNLEEGIPDAHPGARTVTNFLSARSILHLINKIKSGGSLINFGGNVNQDFPLWGKLLDY
jgi:hypothetical protein